jgi:hypothetical protein
MSKNSLDLNNTEMSSILRDGREITAITEDNFLYHTNNTLSNNTGEQREETNALILTINCFTVSGNVAENSSICLSFGNCEITWSNMPLKSCDSSLSACDKKKSLNVYLIVFLESGENEEKTG